MTSGWRCFELLFSAEAPIHIGWHNLGLIMRTRYYIPARALWGILVAGLAPRLGPPEPPRMYGSAATELEKLLRTTALFPVVLDDAQASVLEDLLPTISADEGRRWGEWTDEDFESEFVFSQASTAIDASAFSAEEGALHDSEYLAPVGRRGKRLGFRGYILVNEGLSVADVAQVLNTCWVGADRRYGWGAIRLRNHPDEAPPFTGDLFGCARLAGIDPSSGDPLLEPVNPGQFFLPAHLLCPSADEGSACPAALNAFAGELEVVSGRNWHGRKGSGQDACAATLCWAPGSRFRDDIHAGFRFAIGPQGLWRCAL